MNAIQAGPFIIKYTWLFAITAIVVTYFLLKKLLKEDQEFRDQFLDALINTLLIGMVTYKLSILAYRPELLTTNPLAALYLSGGFKEWLTGIIAGGLYLGWQGRKQSWSPHSTGKAIVYGIVTFITTYWLTRTLFFLLF
ncbi:hypothetical protein SAMN05192533_101288 [Mesobacillus persicus]|uniref:Uncharacterized protein n=1 Tax=Mesobacillus persicus TaxID=930146 RepID=A0A1H7W7V6_9BACI|nr:hypothetical protein [Mesobacillus persicus]SEM17088.1 hypothetical protein SAMN05192533_101288 [Mesobacillus persicus]